MAAGAALVAGIAGVAVWAGALAAQGQIPVEDGTAAELRALDRLSGQLTDVTVPIGEAARIGELDVNVVYCRYPADNPAGDAFAYLLIDDRKARSVVFEGWMLASSPALNALEHRRYDVWVLRCTTS